MIKILKRKVSRNQIEVKGSQGQSGDQNGFLGKSPSSLSSHLPVQYHYQRPSLLGDLTHEEATANASHFDRPLVTPK